MKKYKLLMDPVYNEFVMVERGGILAKILDSLYIQRLRHVRQLGPCYYVYPGAEHTRFQHSIGVMWLAKKALDYLSLKDYQIDEFLKTSILVAALTHDTGHSPFSHALEGVILPYKHEDLTLYALDMLLEELNLEKELINTVKAIIKKEHSLPFVYQLISSQLDCDRLDYLTRDAFYTGVSFGKIDVNRILVSVLIEDGELIWSFKGFNALEAYVMSRYQMYWAVYFHKVNLSVQVLLKKIVERIKELIFNGVSLDMDLTLSKVLKEENIEKFFRLTDGNVVSSIYLLMDSNDNILSDLCKRLVKRNFFETVEVTPSKVLEYRERVERAGFDPKYYFEVIEPSKVAYSYYSPSGVDIIRVKVEDRIDELSNVAPTDALKALSRKVSKTYVVLPKEVLS
ncbi:metal dependent phosphohydrolase [Desulfurobacterium thermolithotrophum DSM 11699]|uniref:Metal dependent phosphohydrolase n=1 Tax=Desulfurobacterium thermolithotrophum (strain DSM 11699 / BSA) TaxID=868864 RepID=F0S0J5_DESTD|nr:HD domain-containing protein [Desulfurobacterium thermolithotrophum]ADY72723.1 metal dependent phosphohydrolase [Desulfurobacterium thermolithotrophum DSM 11699]